MCKNEGWINTESNSYNLWRQKSFLMNCLPRNETIDHLINQSIDHRLMNQSIDQQMIWAWLICTFAAFSSKMAQAHFGDIFHTLGLNIAGPPIFDQITSFSLKIYLRSDDLLIWAQMSRFISQMICDKIFSRSFHVHTYVHAYICDQIYACIWSYTSWFDSCNYAICIFIWSLHVKCTYMICDQIYTYIIYQLATMYNIHPRFPLLQRSLTAKSLPLTLVTLHPPRQPQHDMIRHMSLFTGHLMQLC